MNRNPRKDQHMTRTLTEPVTLRHGAVIPNRIAMAPMQTSSGLRDGYASDETIDYYAARGHCSFYCKLP